MAADKAGSRRIYLLFVVVIHVKQRHHRIYGAPRLSPPTTSLEPPEPSRVQPEFLPPLSLNPAYAASGHPFTRPPIGLHSAPLQHLLPHRRPRLLEGSLRPATSCPRAPGAIFGQPLLAFGLLLLGAPELGVPHLLVPSLLSGLSFSALPRLLGELPHPRLLELLLRGLLFLDALHFFSRPPLERFVCAHVSVFLSLSLPWLEKIGRVALTWHPPPSSPASA